MNTRRFLKAEGSALLLAGRYDYYLNDVLQPISESWAYYENTGGEVVVDSSRQAGNLSLRSRATCVGEGFDRVLVEWRAAESILSLYDLVDQRCYWQLNGGDTLMLPLADLPIYPLMRVYTGAVIKQLAHRGGSTKIIVPDIRLETPGTQKLQPHYSERHCAFIAAEEIHIQDRRQQCEQWTFIGDQYTSDSRFWLDAKSNLLRYSWQQTPDQMWRVDRVVVES